MKLQSSGFNDFLSRFNFNRDMSSFVGVERERFLTNADGLIVPRSQDFLNQINDKRWTHELSACQAEDRTDPEKNVEKVRKMLLENDKKGESIASQIGLKLLCLEVAPEEMPLTVYPNPRYLQIKSSLSSKCLSAACRVAGTHLHFGVPNLQIAIQVYNVLRKQLEYLAKIGDHSQGERLRLYKEVATNWQPPYYKSEHHFFEIAQEQGFSENPRNCWHLVRISIHGTVELRMFGATESLDEICGWINIAKQIIDR